MDSASHLVPGSDPVAPAELAAPHVHFRAADVGLRDFGDEPARGRGRRHVELEEFNPVCARDKGDFSFHDAISLDDYSPPTLSRARRGLPRMGFARPRPRCQGERVPPAAAHARARPWRGGAPAASPLQLAGLAKVGRRIVAAVSAISPSRRASALPRDTHCSLRGAWSGTYSGALKVACTLTIVSSVPLGLTLK